MKMQPLIPKWLFYRLTSGLLLSAISLMQAPNVVLRNKP